MLIGHWALGIGHHQVMKAVLLNSADKIQDSGDGLRLGMSRTLIDKQNKNWLDSDAYKDPKIPLDAQMGAGHLNAFRAYEQFSAGQWQSSAAIPLIGWDYRTVDAGASVDYIYISKTIKAGEFCCYYLELGSIGRTQR
jgi:hypothetical protein